MSGAGRDVGAVSLWELLGIPRFGAAAWMSDGVCAQTDPEVFFPEKGASTTPAKRVCLACPVRVECRDYAVENSELRGVWGGTSERERLALRRQAEGEVAA